MPYELIVTRPGGSEFSPNDGGMTPTESRLTCALQVLRLCTEEGIRDADGRPLNIGEAKALGRMIMKAPVGETVVHEPSGYRFRTLES